MLFLELFLRTTAAVVALLGFGLLMTHKQRPPSFKWIAMFLMSLALGGVIHTAAGIAPPTGVRELILPTSSSLIVFLWIAARSYFIDEFKAGLTEIVIMLTWLFLASFDYLALTANTPTDTTIASTIRQVMSYTLVGHIVFITLKGTEPDLIESRRRLRPGFTLSIITLYLMNKIGEAHYGYSELPLWFTALLYGLISVVLIRGLLAIIKIDTAVVDIHFGTESKRSKPLSISPEQQHLIQRLEHLMTQESIYLDPNLSINDLAKRMSLADHTLRALINQVLGHRNFRAYLNSYRVKHASHMLLSSEKKHAVLDIAMDSGFGSLASFNRIFKEATGQSPREFRSTQIN